MLAKLDRVNNFAFLCKHIDLLEGVPLCFITVSLYIDALIKKILLKSTSDIVRLCGLIRNIDCDVIDFVI